MKMSQIETGIKVSIKVDAKEVEKVVNDFTANPFMVPFFNFFYYIALVPFKTELNLNNNRYELKTCLIHQFLCGVVHIGLLVCMNFNILDGFKKISLEDSSSIVDIFDCGSNFGTSISSALLVYMLWMRRAKYLDVIDKTRIKFESKNRLRITHLMVQIGFAVVLVHFGILDWFLMTEDSSFGQPNFIYSKSQNSIYSLNLTNNQIDDFSDNSSIVNNTSSTSGSNDFIILLRNCLYYLFVLFMFEFHIMCQLVFLVLAMSLMKLEKEFSTEMLNSCFGEDGVKQGIKKYRKLKSITDLVRNVYGNALLAYYLSAVAYYAKAPHVIWGRRGETEKMVMVYFVVSGVIWLIAAEFHNNVKTTLMKWIEFHIDLDETTCDHRMRLHIISGEITSHDSSTVALANKCFPVTYSHLGSMLGLVVTYGIIVFQLHQNQDEKLNHRPNT